MFIKCVLHLTVVATVVGSRQKRQLSIDDLISGALSLVRPIFDTSKSLQNNNMLRKPDAPTQDDIRDSSILGSRGSIALDDLPLCKGSSAICHFISCSAENFKKDPAFSNIQLAAQVLGDTKLRNAISSNPETVTAVCKEQGMDDAQCKLFSKGFQLIDKFITTIEKPAEKMKKLSGESVASTAAPNKPLGPQFDDPSFDSHSGNGDNTKVWSDYDMLPPSPPAAPGGNSKNLGSKTWSSNPQPRPLQALEVRNDLVSSWTPIPLVAPPTIPSAPPLAFKIVPSLIVPPIQLPSMDNGLFFSTDKFGFLGKDENSIKRSKRAADYYDQLDKSAKPGQNVAQVADSDVDYYGGVEEGSQEPASDTKMNGLKQCVNLLGLDV